MSPERKVIPTVLSEYVEKSLGWGLEKSLSGFIERALKKQWDDRLIYQYGRIAMCEEVERLAIAEKWLINQKSSQAQNPVLLLTLGRLVHKLDYIDDQ